MLEDLLRPGLKLVICGSAAGKRSARLGAYYAGRRNVFWQTLRDTGFTGAVLLTANEYRRLAEFGIGLTDLAKGVAGEDATIAREHYKSGQLRAKILEYRPHVLAFNGKNAAGIFLEKPTKTISYGAQAERVGETALWVLPSTSGAARGYWTPAPWTELAQAISK
jgi:double-stranded uracil-DNA glycosylase